MNLQELRQEIDKLDNQLLQLLGTRCELVKQVGLYKKEHNISPLQSDRWQQVLDDKIEKAEQLGLDIQTVVDIWNKIHECALKLENQIKSN